MARDESRPASPSAPNPELGFWAAVYIMPLVGVALSGWLLGDPLYPNLWMALVLIVAGILVLHCRPMEGIAIFPLRRHV